ncbi:hypothetical protein DA89_783 [Vibrio paracholerae]|nr:hypothetical protein DA89_783 [Vibrio paracholerae]
MRVIQSTILLVWAQCLKLGGNQFNTLLMKQILLT